MIHIRALEISHESEASLEKVNVIRALVARIQNRRPILGNRGILIDLSLEREFPKSVDVKTACGVRDRGAILSVERGGAVGWRSRHRGGRTHEVGLD